MFVQRLNEKGPEQKENLQKSLKEMRMRNGTGGTLNRKEKSVHPKMKMQKKKLIRKKKGQMRQKMLLVQALRSKHWRRYCVKKH